MFQPKFHETTMPRNHLSEHRICTRNQNRFCRNFHPGKVVGSRHDLAIDIDEIVWTTCQDDFFKLFEHRSKHYKHRNPCDSSAFVLPWSKSLRCQTPRLHVERCSPGSASAWFIQSINDSKMTPLNSNNAKSLKLSSWYMCLYVCIVNILYMIYMMFRKGSKKA